MDTAGPLIREADTGDLEAVIAIDAQISGLAKPDYWRDMYRTYSGSNQNGFFLVAEAGGQVAGFVLGEIRAWEFGSPPCGWVFGISVRDEQRLHGTGSELLQQLCHRFQQAGVSRVRTMVSRQNRELLAFFRSHGMMAGPYVELEKDLA